MTKEEILKAAEEIGKEIGATMIVHDAVTIGAKKEINGETYGDYFVLITDDGAPDFFQKNKLNEFKNDMAAQFRKAAEGK